MESGSLGLGMVLLYALLPSLGNLIGVGLAEWRQPPGWLTGAAMHAAAGIGTAVAATELLPPAQDTIATHLLALSMVAGALASVGLAGLTKRLNRRLSGGVGRVSTWGAYAAIGIDLFTDGLMTGSGAAISAGLGLLLALSQVLGNIPGGFAIAANFRSAEITRRRRLSAMAAYPVLPVFGALIGYLVLQGASEMVTGLVLALFAGLLLTATIEDIVPEADEPGAPRRISSPAFASGFVALLLMSAYLGE